ncbi:MAG: 2,3-bisphosphoglycerate-independent phosphoglycerate mutase [Candidatus Brocadiia bacterium]
MKTTEITQNLVKDRSAWPREDMSLVLLVMDGVGDVRHPDFGMRTPLEVADTPNLDDLAPRSAVGRILPVDYGITPGSGPAHLGLFGYDPRELIIGRGVLEAVGIDMNVQPGDLAARCNMCTIEDGIITDRRAGRPETERTAEKCELLQREIGEVEDCEIIIQPGKGHRFAVIFRGPGLNEGVTDTDPHENGEPLHDPKPTRPEAEKAARIVAKFQQRALDALEGCEPMNAILCRGVAELPQIDGMEERFSLRSGAIATYPMYRGLAQLAGMDLLDTGTSVEDEFNTYLETRRDYDYHFIHVKKTDEGGEDGDFDKKVRVIEETDAALPMILEANPEVVAITGDHSTPCCMELHSWHPVPLMLHSPRCDASGVERFTEQHCNGGPLGIFRAQHLISLMLSNAALLDKFGA